jgi:glycosyltransferase involved in cell wall biosynthesis
MTFFVPLYSLAKKPDSVIVTPGAFVIPVTIWAKVLAKPLRIKFVLDIRSTPVEVVSRRARLILLFFNISVLLARKALDGITVITEAMRLEISRKFDLDQRKVGLWTCGVSTELFNAANFPDAPVRLRRDLRLEGKLVILYHGVFGLKRGIIESVKAMSAVSGDVVLFLLGDGAALPAIMETIKQGGLADRVVVHKPVKYEDVPKYVAMCDVGLVPLPDMPDWRNQNPLSLLECLAMGKPVILTDIPANRSVVGNDRCGIYVPSATPTNFAKAMQYCNNHREALNRWGSSGRTLVQNKYTWTHVAKCLDDYLTSLTDGLDR